MPSASPGDATATNRRAGRRIRQATFILPKTGERSKRPFTLRDASNRPSRSTSDDEREPLIARRRGSNYGWFSPDSSLLARVWYSCRAKGQLAWSFACSPTGRAIFKCSIAYLIGSLATFYPPVARIFGRLQDSKHMVATVAVYFHPARSMGNMYEAVIAAFGAFIYAAIMSGGSMALSIWFGKLQLLGLGHAIVLIVFVGGGFGFMAFLKQWLGNPIVNTGISLAAITVCNILIREGSVQYGVFSMYTVTQNLGMTIAGILVAAIVNAVVLPSLARKKLSREMEKNTDLLGEMLISITRAFLHGREGDLEDDFYTTLSKEHAVSLNAMKTALHEARNEHYVLGNEKIYDVEARIVGCLNRLSQDLGGLKSASLAEFDFLDQDTAGWGSTTPKVTSPPVSHSGVVSSPNITSPQENGHYFSSLDIIREAPEERPSAVNSPVQTVAAEHTRSQDFATPTGTATPGSVHSDVEAVKSSQDTYAGNNIARSPGDMFVAFISQLGPPTKSLVFTLKQILDELPFRQVSEDWNPWANRELEVAVSEQFHISLREAIELYRRSRQEALSVLYQNRAIHAAFNAQHFQRSTFSTRAPNTPNPSSPAEVRHAPQHQKTLFNRKPEEVLADIEEVSACCGHFSFSLLDFAEEVLHYLDILDDLKHEMETQRRSWKWLISWRRKEAEHSQKHRTATEAHGDPVAGNKIASPSKKADYLLDTKKTQSDRPWYFKLYQAFSFIRRDDVRFAIKIGLGAALYSLPAFLSGTRPFFLYWRLEWGLASYMIVASMTTGAINTTGTNRITGCSLGAIAAALAWVVSDYEGEPNPYLLAFLGWLMSFVGFYIIVGRNDPAMGRSVFLSYNLVALYAYSLSTHQGDNDQEEGGVEPAIWLITLHRFVSVGAGSIWALIVIRFVAPISARKKLREGLCVLWLRMGLIWKRDPLAVSLLGEPGSSYMKISEESELNSFLASLRSMRKAANSEFEFRGPFPDKAIGRMLDRSGRMLDAFHAMNVVISKDLTCTVGEAAVLQYTRTERFALSARISHLFSVLASSLKLEFPLNDVLPDIDHRRDLLLAKISEYRRTSEGRDITTEADYEMLYAYVLVTGQLANDMKVCHAEIEELYGTLNDENLKLH